MRTTTEVFQDHLQRRLAGDLEGDIKNNYSEKVVILTGTGVFKGHNGVRESASGLKNYLGKTQGFQYKHTLVEGKYAFLEWIAESDDKAVCDGADGFVIENGKITMQNIHYSVNDKS